MAFGRLSVRDSTCSQEVYLKQPPELNPSALVIRRDVLRTAYIRAWPDGDSIYVCSVPRTLRWIIVPGDVSLNRSLTLTCSQLNRFVPMHEGITNTGLRKDICSTGSALHVRYQASSEAI